MAIVGSVKALFVADTGALAAAGREASDIFGRLGREATKLGEALTLQRGASEFFAGIGKIATLGAGIAIVDKLRDGAKEAAKLAGAGKTLSTVFGSAAKDVTEDIDRMETQFGKDPLAVTRFAAKTGAILKQQGLSQVESADMVRQIMMDAANAAAATGVSYEEALEALGSAAAGKTRPLKELGVVMISNKTNASDFARTMEALEDEFGNSSKGLQALSYAHEQLAQWQGRAAAAAQGLTGTQARAAAETDKAWRQAGSAATPIFKFLAESAAGLAQLLGFIIEKIGDAYNAVHQWFASGLANLFGWQQKVNTATAEESERLKEVAQAQADARREAAKRQEEQLRYAEAVKKKQERMAADARNLEEARQKSMGGLKTGADRDLLGAKTGASPEAIRLAAAAVLSGNGKGLFEARSVASAMDAADEAKRKFEIERSDPFRSRSATLAMGGSQENYRLTLAAMGYDHAPEKATAKNTGRTAQALDKLVPLMQQMTKQELESLL